MFSAAIYCPFRRYDCVSSHDMLAPNVTRWCFCSWLVPRLGCGTGLFKPPASSKCQVVLPMSRQPPPPPSFPQPYETTRSSNRRQNAAGDSAYLQAGPPSGHAYPSQSAFSYIMPLVLVVHPIKPRLFLGHSPNVHPAQLYPESSSHPSAPRRYTDPTAPTYEHASYSHPSAPGSLSGTVSHYPTYPDSTRPTRYASTNSSGVPPPVVQRAVTMPIPVPSNAAPSMPYGTSPPNIMHPPSYPQMSGRPQPTSTSQSRNYRACTTFVLLTVLV